MTAIYAPTRQAYVPPDGEPPLTPTRDPITRHLYKIGQVGPNTEQEWMMHHGRYLAGLGGLNETQPPWDREFKETHTRELEEEDDVHGSGIFDTYGRQATVHTNMGVFADHPSVPGFIDREVQYAVNRNIADLPSGADVVTVAGGGMTYIERNRFPVPFDRTGPTPCPPELQPPPPTALDEVYASMSPIRRPSVPMLPGGPRTRGGGPAMGPPSAPGSQPMSGLGACPQRVFTKFPPVPYATPQTPVPRAPLFMPAIVPNPVGTPYNPPRVPYNVPIKPFMLEDISMTAIRKKGVPAPLMGLGAEEEKPGWPTYLFAGLLVGGSAALFFGARKKRSGR